MPSFERITSKDNALVKEWRALCTEAKRRRETGKFAIEGARLCGDALISGLTVETVLYTADARGTYPVTDELITAAARSAEISPELARTMADTAHPQGVFCTVKILDNRLKSDKIDNMGRYVALEDMQDPGNLGTVFRTAEALGVDGILLSPGCCDPYNAKVLRGSMGGVFRLPWTVAENFPETLTALQERGMTAFACMVDRSADPVQSAGMGRGAIAVIGNEGNGLRPETAAACKRRITIPMAGRAESLNASMAAGIVLWEMVRPEDKEKVD